MARIRVDAAAASLWQMAPVIESIRIDAPKLSIRRIAEGQYDIDDLISRFSKPEPATDKDDAPPRFALHNLQLVGGSVRLDDQPVARVHQVQALTLTLPFLSNLPSNVRVKVQPRLSFTLNGVAFDSGAQATPFAQSREADLELKLAPLDVAPYLGYLPNTLPVRLKAGVLAAELKLHFAQGPSPAASRPAASAGSQPASQAASQPAAQPAPQTITDPTAPQVQLQGWLEARNLSVHDSADAPLLAWQELRIDLRDVQPLQRQIKLAALRLNGAALTLRRAADGQLNLMRLAAAGAAPAQAPPGATPVAPPGATPVTPVGTASTAGAATQAPGAAATLPAAAPWRIELDELQLKGAQIQLADASVAPPAAWQIDGLDLRLQRLRWPAPEPMPVQASAVLRRGGLTNAPTIGSLAVEGQASDHRAALNLRLEGLQLAPLAPYLAPVLAQHVSGNLTAQAALEWSDAADSPALKLTLATATLEALRLGDGPPAAAATAAPRTPPQPPRRGASAPAAAIDASASASVQRLGLSDVQADLLKQTLQIGKVQLQRPMLQLARDASGVWNVQRWLQPPPSPANNAAAPVAAAASAAAPVAWSLRLKDIVLDAGELGFSDAAPVVTATAAATTALTPSTPNANLTAPDPSATLRATLSALRLRAQDLAWPAATGAPIKLQLATQLLTPASATQAAGQSSLEWTGQLGLAPLQAQGKLNIERLPVHAFERYFSAALPVALQRAELGLQGEMSMRQEAAGLRLDATSALRVADLLVHTRPAAGSESPGDELISWQLLQLDGVHVLLAPQALPSIEVRAATLSDFYSRLVITDKGRFNLQDVAAAPAVSATAAASASASAAAASPSASAQVVATAAPAASAPQATPPGAGLPILLAMGPTKLINGRIDFSDRFVRPNYSTRLTELNGQIGAFRSDTRAMAAIELRGKAEGTAALEVVGQVNPTAQPLALDIRAKATDLELAPFSPYAGKYAGYAIERGKLSMDVSYKIDEAGRLDAKNQVILNQLTFGEKVDSPDATSLPVRLALALLKDRNGVIDINLPVSGTLNDPQFSVFGIVVKVIVNLLTKAFTAPFALLAGGGGDDLSFVGFEPGVAALTAPGREAIDKVAQALIDRPALTMTVAGAADPASEREAIQHNVLDERLQAERRRELVRAGAPAAPLAAAAASVATSAASSASASVATPSASPPAVILSAEDRSRLLKELYRQSPLPNKPRNAAGVALEIPGSQIEALLRQSILVSTETARELALQRGITVRDALVAKGLPSARLFLAAPKLRASGEDDAAWSPRVLLTLAVP